MPRGHHMAAGTQRFFGSKIQSAAFAEHGLSPTVLVWACSAPASDYRERFDKDYWSEVQRNVRPSRLSFRAVPVSCKWRRVLRASQCLHRAHTLGCAFSEFITEGTEKSRRDH